MWYFAWILGVTAALAIGIINVMWFEFQNEFETRGTVTGTRSASIEGPAGERSAPASPNAARG